MFYPTPVYTGCLLKIGELIRYTGNRTRQKEQLFYVPIVCRKTMFEVPKKNWRDFSLRHSPTPLGIRQWLIEISAGSMKKYVHFHPDTTSF
jgi:hypothetical protein